MKDDLVPGYQPNSPRVLLLSASSLNSTLRQHLYDCPDWTLSHSSAPRGEVEAALVLLDVRSYDRDTNVHLLRQIGDTPVALVNAQRCHATGS